MLIKYLFSLGSNLDDRLLLLSLAVKKLSFLGNIKISSIYETKAMLLEHSDPEWDKNFLNLVISGISNLSPIKMLELCKAIEKEIGRDLSSPRWSPRVIDIDILLAGEHIINSDKLTVPHLGMLERGFVLVPACEIEANLVHPCTHKPLHEHLKKLNLDQVNKIKETTLKLMHG